MIDHRTTKRPWPDTGYVFPEDDGTYSVYVPRRYRMWDGDKLPDESRRLEAWLEERGVPVLDITWEGLGFEPKFTVQVPDLTQATLVYLGLMDGVPE